MRNLTLRKVLKRVFLFGYYGYGNFGDELYSEYFTKLLIENFPENDLFLLTADSDASALGQKFPGVVQVNRWRLGKIAGLISSGDLLMGGGGSLLQNVTSTRSLLYYLALIKTANVKKAKIILAGQGLGPLSRLGAALTTPVLNKTDIIFCRDPVSVEMLLKMKVNSPMVHEGVDPLWDYEIPGSDTATEAGDTVRYGNSKLTFRNSDNSGGTGKNAGFNNNAGIIIFFRPGDFSKKMRLLAVLKKFYNVKLLTLAPDDSRFLYKIAEMTGSLPPVFVRNIQEFTAICHGKELVIGEKLHGLLFAARLGIPGIGLGQDPKIKAFCQVMEWPCLSPGGGEESEKLISEIRKIRNNYQSLLKTTAEKVAWLQNQAARDRDRLTRYLREVLS